MKAEKYIVFLLAVMLGMPVLMAQQVRQQAVDDFTRISKKYEKQEKYKMELTYTLFADSMPNTPVSEVNGIAIVSGRRKYQKVGEMESYYTEKYSVVFNHALKTVSFMPSAPQKTGIAEGGFQFLGSFIAACDSISSSDHAEDRMYTFSGLTGNYNRVEVTFNRKTYLVSSVKLVSAYQQSALLITYSGFSTKAIPSDEWFSYTNFLSYENRKLQCKTPFESYELFNQITNLEIIK